VLLKELCTGDFTCAAKGLDELYQSHTQTSWKFMSPAS
jgi:hypothetical protein